MQSLFRLQRDGLLIFTNGVRVICHNGECQAREIVSHRYIGEVLEQREHLFSQNRPIDFGEVVGAGRVPDSGPKSLIGLAIAERVESLITYLGKRVRAEIMPDSD